MNDTSSNSSFDRAAYDADVAAAEALALTLTVPQQDALAECGDCMGSAPQQAITAKRVAHLFWRSHGMDSRKAEGRARSVLGQLVKKGLLDKRVDGHGYHAKATYSYDNSSEARYGWSVVWHCAKACRSLWAVRYRAAKAEAEAALAAALPEGMVTAKVAKVTTTQLCRRCHVACEEGHEHCDACHDAQAAEHAEQCGGLEPGQAPKVASCTRCHKPVCGATTMDQACCDWYGSSRCCGLGVQQSPACCDGYHDSCVKAIDWVLVQREHEAVKCGACLALRQARVAARRGN